jgi:ATP-dependent exoDNAse (exonuclease V) beta subunit
MRATTRQLARALVLLAPLVVAGGTCAYNPEPLAPFVDFFVLGEGEEVTLEHYLAHVALFTNADTAEQGDKVRLMTVHAAKGLEFPVCILAGTSKRYNTDELSDDLLINTKYGFGVKIHNEEMMYNVPSLPYAVIKSKKANELMSENLRVLYVAMTRAIEKLQLNSDLKKFLNYI